MPASKSTSKPKTAQKPAKRPSVSRSGRAGKAEGDAAARRWIKDVQASHRPLVEAIDAIVAKEVPNAKRAIKWSSLMYGRSGAGYFASIGAFSKHINLAFFEGAKLDPEPPEGTGELMRRVRLETLEDLDTKQVRSWIKQAAAMKGWGTA